MLYGFSELSGSPLYPKYLQFRHRVFNGRLGYHQPGGPVSTFEAFPNENSSDPWAGGIEFDACDSPKTIHFAYVSQGGDTADTAYIPAVQGKVTGCIRILPTDGRYMIRDAIEYGMWKNVPLLEALPVSADVYEASRIAISPDFDLRDPARGLILDNLVYGHVELAHRLGVKRMLGIMYKGVWRTVYEKRGVPIRYLSEPFKVDDGHPIVIAEIQFNDTILAGMRQRFANQLATGAIAVATVDAQTLLAHQYHVRRVQS